jgi:hypothetical protein
MADRASLRRCAELGHACAHRRRSGVVITGWIPVALVHLGIRRVEQAVRSGWQLKFSTLPVRVNRRGYQVVLIAADAVTPEMIADERNVCYQHER